MNNQTLSQLLSIFKAYISNLQSIDVETDEEFYAAINVAKEKMFIEFIKYRDEHPELLFCNYSPKMSEKTARQIISTIQKNTQHKYDISTIPCVDYDIYTIQYEKIITPSFIDSLEGYNKIEVGKCYGAKQDITQFLLTLLLSLPIKKIKYTFVDFGGSLLSDFFLKKINPSFYNTKPITDTAAFKDYLKKLKDKVIKNVQQYGDIREYNKKNKTIVEPYEVIVLFDNADKGDNEYLHDYETELNALKRNCASGGIYIIDFVKEDSINEIPQVALVKPAFIEDIPALRQACIDYINTEAVKEEETRIISMDIQSASQKTFEPLNDTMSISIGKSGNMEVSLKMETDGTRAHTFIIGQSGSGKSVLLHNIISGLMLTYSPEDLELYLLDFKLGGVEFNRYKGKKHIHAMLVDNSDPQITLEILRELRDRMAERGKKLRQSGCNTIKEYNLQHSDDKMKRILFVADECHEMFRIDDNNRAIGREISEILTMIVKEGRSQGVHLLLATQTLANTEIGSDILTNIGNHLMLKCSIADSEKLVQNTSNITSNLKTGAVYYHEDNVTMQAYFADKEQVKNILDTIKQKTEPYSSNEKFYFSGASIFHFEPSSAIDSSAGIARKCRRMPVAFVGKSIDIEQKDVAIPLSEDYSENILLLGLNDEYQTTRTSMNLLVSLLATCKSRGAEVAFKVIDCLSDDDKYAEVLDELEDAGLVEVVSAKKRASLFKKLAEEIYSEKAEETILFILGQDRFRELKLDLEFEEDNKSGDDELTSIISFGSGAFDKKTMRTFSEAMNVILDKGPEVGVHTIIQLEKAVNYLFTDYISHKELFQKFKHLILLKSDENASMQLHLRNDIRLENLSKDEERLRAYYYAEESDTYTLFTPYMPLGGKDLKQFIKSL